MKILVEYKNQKGYIVNIRESRFSNLTICDVVLNNENDKLIILDIPMQELIVVDSEYVNDEKLKNK